MSTSLWDELILIFKRIKCWEKIKEVLFQQSKQQESKEGCLQTVEIGYYGNSLPTLLVGLTSVSKSFWSRSSTTEFLHSQYKAKCNKSFRVFLSYNLDRSCQTLESDIKNLAWGKPFKFFFFSPSFHFFSFSSSFFYVL